MNCAVSLWKMGKFLRCNIELMIRMTFTTLVFSNVAIFFCPDDTISRAYIQTCLVNAHVEGGMLRRGFLPLPPLILSFFTQSLKNVFIGSFSCLLSVDFLSGNENKKNWCAVFAWCLSIGAAVCKLFSCWFFLLSTQKKPLRMD